jgi:hypothetical protein
MIYVIKDDKKRRKDRKEGSQTLTGFTRLTRFEIQLIM